MALAEIPVLDHGSVALDDVMGDDRTAARCARSSYRNRNRPRTPEEDARLTRFLVRKRHTTPLEFCQLRFYIVAPMSVANQIKRHRTASINEMSMRYVRAERRYYLPPLARMRKQAQDSKQGSSSELVPDPDSCQLDIERACEFSFDVYEKLCAGGLAHEVARGVLPVYTYTEWYWQTNLHNFLHFSGLRMAPDAQEETRMYAEAMFDLARAHFPTAIGEWERIRRGGV